MQMKQRNRKTTITIGLIPEIHLLLKIIVFITYFNSKKVFYILNEFLSILLEINNLFKFQCRSFKFVNSTSWDKLLSTFII